VSSGGKGGGGSTVVGYRYFLGVHMIVASGVVDSINEIKVGERSAWKGKVTTQNFAPPLDVQDFIRPTITVNRDLSSFEVETLQIALTTRIQYTPPQPTGMAGAANFTGLTSFIWGDVPATIKNAQVSEDEITFWAVVSYITITRAAKVRMARVGDGLTTIEILAAKSVSGDSVNFDFENGGTSRPIATNTTNVLTANANIIGVRSIKAPARSRISINKPNLFGGDKREGGVAGTVDMLFGLSNQPRNDYLARFQGKNCPAYRGFTSLVFRSFMWSALNPYFKPVWVNVTRQKQGWARGACWYPEKVQVGVDKLDMNPAHIIYECLTDYNWGMGYTPADIDEVSFRAAADTLYAENFGLSLTWKNQSTVEQFVQLICDHIDANIQVDRSTGKFVLKLIRGDYDPDDLVDLTPDNIIEMKSFQRATVGEQANEIVVTWRDRDGDDKPITVHDMASIQAQGGVISSSREYTGIRTAELAARVAMRDLNLVSATLAKVELVTTRILWKHNKGDVVNFSWPDHGILRVPFRIIDIKFGNLLNGKIEVQMVEDVFGLPFGTYTDSPDTEWVSPIAEAQPVEKQRIVEAPYWTVFFRTTRADYAYLEPEFGFGVALATRGAFNYPLNLGLWASPTGTTGYTEVGRGQFCPTGTLLGAVDKSNITFYLADFYDLDLVKTDDDNGFAYINSEIVAIESVNAETGEVVVRRGCLDTVPVEHATGSTMYFITGSEPVDPTEHVAGETTYYKCTPNTAISSFNVDDAIETSITFDNRASRPYPPGMPYFNNEVWPASLTAVSLVFFWTNRNRILQTVRLVDTTEDSITPEAGTTYNLRIYNAVTNALIIQFTGSVANTRTWTPAVGTYNIRVELESVVAGVVSLQKHVHEMTFTKV
jgi:hypothetical protein